jgi:hypothetical protein
VRGAGHAETFGADRAAYLERVEAFLARFLPQPDG